MTNALKVTRRAAAAAAVSVVAMTGAAFADDGPIKIGFAIAESGWLSNYDQPPFRAAVMRIEEINADGGLLGRQIEYSVVDTKTDQQFAATVGQQMVANGVDLLVVSCDYDFGAPAALAASQAGIVNISLCAGDPKMGVQGVGPYTFSANNSGQSEGIAMAEYATKVMGLESVYILEDVTIEYNRSATSGFRAAWLNDRPEESLLGRDTFMNDDASIAAQITRIRSLPEAPDAIYMCSITPGGASAVRQMRAAGLEMPILSCTAMVDNYWLDAAPGLKDFWVPGFMSLYGDDPRADMNAFIEAHVERWEEMPVSSYAVNGYSLIEAWELAVERAGTTETPAVVAEMEKFTDEPLLAGSSTYTPELHILLDRPYLMMKVEDGSFRAVEMFRAEFKPDLKLLFRVGE